jgi:hypothetical protein
MWLEELAWGWLPIVCAYLAWTTWRISRLEREVNALRKQLGTDRDEVPSSMSVERARP